MKKNPILMKVAKGSPMQENYDSPAKLNLAKKLGKKVVKKVKEKVKKKVTKVKKKVTDVKNFFNTDED
mgnify:CR=1 FL=1